ncbi:hypothetical protein GCM10018954_016680 [Kutzneria kofuensis]
MRDFGAVMAVRSPDVTGMSEEPALFRQAVEALRSVRPRPEVELAEVRAPQRLAPWSFAFSARANGPADEVATGRLVLLHDPDGEDAWGGVLRVVTFVRAELDAELAVDPLLPAVAWSWLTDALGLVGEVDGAGRHRHAELLGPVSATSPARPAPTTWSCGRRGPRWTPS